MKHFKKQMQFALGFFFSAIIIIWAVKSLDWQEVWQTLQNAHYGWVAAAAGLNILVLIIRSFRWNALFLPQSFCFASLFPPLVLGQAVNFISPARVGDLLRAYLLGQSTGVSKALSLGTIALEKMWDTLVLLFLVGAIALFFPLPAQLQESAWGLFMFSFVGVVGFALVLWRQSLALAWINRIGNKIVPRFAGRLTRFTHNLFQGFGSAANWRVIIIAGGWSLLAWGLSGLLNYVVFLAFDISLSLLPAFLLLVALYVGIAIPSLPGRIGVFQAICVFILALFGVPYSAAFGYSLILHLTVFLPPILLGALFAFSLHLPFKKAQNIDFTGWSQ